MLIITPNGVKTYVWKDEDELPRELVPDDGMGSSNAPGSNYASNGNPYGYPPSGNVYSGYGGYEPTYPTSSVTPPAPSGATSEEKAPPTPAQPTVE